MKKQLVYIILIDILLAGILVYQTFFIRYAWEGSEEKKFTVKSGENLDQVIDKLYEQDIIPSKTLFKLVVKVMGKEGDIKANTYLIPNNISNLGVLEIVTGGGSFVLVRYTLPPGSTMKQAAKLAEKILGLSQEKFLAECVNDSIAESLGLGGKIRNLEGFLYPESYDVSPGITEKELIGILVDEFRKRVIDDEEVMKSVIEGGNDLLKTVTLASIIEAETSIAEEEPVIAGVYLNRLAKGMRLEADPTVQYALPDGPKKRLLYEDLKIKSPYNTYLNSGLPPGPINNPGISCIIAALNPAKHEYLFFVATGNGGHKFSKNYAEHLKAVDEYRRNRSKRQ